MEYSKVVKWINTIQVTNLMNADVLVVNPTPLKLVGKSRKAAIFQVDDSTCVHIFSSEDDCNREYYALSLGQHTSLFPRMYDKGPIYILMDNIHGISVFEYLQTEHLTFELSIQLIDMLVQFKDIGFEQIDHSARKFFIQSDGGLKAIEVGWNVWVENAFPYPRKLLKSLGEEDKETFLDHVEEISPVLYNEWINYMQIEVLARQIYHKLAQTKSSRNADSEHIIMPYLSLDDDKIHQEKLKNLIRFVYEEEWQKLFKKQKNKSKQS